MGICIGHLLSDSMLRYTHLPSFQFQVSFWIQKAHDNLIIIIPHRLRQLNTQVSLGSFWICSNVRTSMSLGAGLRVHSHALHLVFLPCVIRAVKTWYSRFLPLLPCHPPGVILLHPMLEPYPCRSIDKNILCVCKVYSSWHFITASEM